MPVRRVSPGLPPIERDRWWADSQLLCGAQRRLGRRAESARGAAAPLLAADRGAPDGDCGRVISTLARAGRTGPVARTERCPSRIVVATPTALGDPVT